ncbi:MaoC family dehydratase N-terminal domain-containing protein [Sphingobium sp. H39-3-25]|uniref:MaoC family dehydratase N-terminal domain-containing protein n=1 Tax=Sphingobium arseniciresistens TaxID=3030834 RepID=UPI0023B9AA80|nr:MaoC family dehydratase N-terminal domain-containing protein [Sphingobium arseniciresistens]
MYIDRERALKHPIASLPIELERGRLRFFSRTIGLTDPIYLDVDAAIRAGHRDLPAPPTFLSNAIELDIPDPLGWLAELGGDLTKTTHAEQSFTYLGMAYAGDSLMLRRRITDVYTKKGGQLEFVVKRTTVMRGEETLAEIDFTIALRHPEATT